LQDIKTTADNINESKRNLENQQKLKSIEENFTKSLSEKLATPGRGYIREATFLVKEPKKKIFEEHLVFLFSDSILDTKRKKEKLNPKKLTILKGVQVTPLPDTKEQKNLFSVAKNSESYEFIASASSQAEKNLWVNDIQGIIDKLSGVRPPPSLQRTPTMNVISKFESLSQSITRQPSGNLNPPTSPGVLRKSGNYSNEGSTPPSSPLSESPLPSDWKESQTPDGKRYYFNTVTKQTSWTRPDSSPTVQHQAPESQPPSQSVGEWREAMAPDGRIYYFNTVTKQTSWVKPQ